MKAHDILKRAGQHMLDRARTYDKPDGERSMARTVAAFNALTGHSISEADGWTLMMLLKHVRLTQRAFFHEDSAEDLAAYAALLGEARHRETSATLALMSGSQPGATRTTP